jgi:hypothetical protein
MVGLAGFEPATSASRTRRSSQAEPQPEEENRVGKAGFEPATSSSQSWRATRLRYFPLLLTVGREGLEPP